MTAESSSGVLQVAFSELGAETFSRFASMALTSRRLAVTPVPLSSCDRARSRASWPGFPGGVRAAFGARTGGRGRADDEDAAPAVGEQVRDEGLQCVKRGPHVLVEHRGKVRGRGVRNRLAPDPAAHDMDQDILTAVTSQHSLGRRAGCLRVEQIDGVGKDALVGQAKGLNERRRACSGRAPARRGSRRHGRGRRSIANPMRPMRL